MWPKLTPGEMTFAIVVDLGDQRAQRRGDAGPGLEKLDLGRGPILPYDSYANPPLARDLTARHATRMHRPPRLLLAAMLLSCTREPRASSAPSAPQSPQQHSEAVESTHAGEPDLPQWTPEMHAAARALVDQDFPNGRAAIEAAMKGSHRTPGAADRDRYRHPAETLEIFGFTTTMTVLDIAPAECIPGARVGTVDKFQGQEVPVVIYSMATSSSEEAPHGMGPKPREVG